MRIKDPTEWFDDLTVQVDDEDIIEQAQAMEPTLLHSGSKSAAAACVAIAGVAGGAFGGFMLSPEVRSSFLAFIGYLAACVLLLRVLAPSPNA